MCVKEVGGSGRVDFTEFTHQNEVVGFGRRDLSELLPARPRALQHDLGHPRRLGRAHGGGGGGCPGPKHGRAHLPDDGPDGAGHGGAFRAEPRAGAAPRVEGHLADLPHARLVRQVQGVAQRQGGVRLLLLVLLRLLMLLLLPRPSLEVSSQ